ncbi:MAG TPA: sporulation protein YtfJ [Clostridiales bacterium]|nr:sporulation protein YtfJ [Clostridiales bacterium]
MSEQNHPINEVLQTTMGKIREMVDANTVVGQPIVTQDGVTLIPVSRLSFGFATGGSDFGKSPEVHKNFGGGAGAGVNVIPVAFLIVKDGNVKLLPVAPPSNDSVSRVVEMVPEMFDKVTGYIDKRAAEKQMCAGEQAEDILG